MSAPHRLGFLLAASLASTIGGLPFNALPVLLGSLADGFQLAPAAVGLMGSTCFAGYLAGTLGAPFWINRLNWRLLTVVSALGTAGAFALSASVTGLATQYAVWALIGFFASTMTCLGLRVIAELPDAERAFGFRQGVELTITAAVLFALPPLVIAPFRYPGAAWALAAVVLLLGLSAPWVPQRGAAPASAQAGTRRALPLASWVGLAVFFVFLAGNIALWAFLERIGSGLRLEPAQTGLVFAVLKLLGGAAAFFVAWLGERSGTRWPLWVVLAGVVAGLALLGTAQGFVAYAAGAWIWEFAFTCGCVYQAAAIARGDPTGRAVVLVPAVFALSSMVGPGVAGQLAADGRYGGVLVLAGLCSLLPAALQWARWRRASAVGAAGHRR